MCELDIRPQGELDIRPQGKIERIRFGDEDQDQGAWCIMECDMTENYQVSICSDMEYVSLCDAHHARMLIAALEKAIEIGKLK